MSVREYDDEVETREVDWVAFRYASGELDPAGSLAFEGRLATDPSACEALVRAVELIETARGAAVAMPLPARTGSRRRQVPGKVAAAFGAAAATVALYVAMGPAGRPRAPQIGPWSNEAVQTWASLSPESVGAEPVAWEGEPIVEEPPAAEVPPSWMLEIASLEAASEPGAEEGPR